MPNVANILVAPADVWISATGVALPDETTVAAGASWGANWTHLGYTMSALSVSFASDTFDLDVEQLSAPIKSVKVKEDITFEVMLAELTAANMRYSLATNSTVTTVAAGANQHGFDTLKVGGSVLVPEYQLGFEAVKLDTSARSLVQRFFIYRAVLTLGGKLEFTKKAATGIPLRVRALADSGKADGQQMIEMQFVTAWKTS